MQWGSWDWLAGYWLASDWIHFQEVEVSFPSFFSSLMRTCHRLSWGSERQMVQHSESPKHEPQDIPCYSLENHHFLQRNETREKGCPCRGKGETFVLLVHQADDMELCVFGTFCESGLFSLSHWRSSTLNAAMADEWSAEENPISYKRTRNCASCCQKFTEG